MPDLHGSGEQYRALVNHRFFFAARLAAACSSAHPALVWVAAALTLVAATGYIVHATIPRLAPAIWSGSVESDAKTRDTVIWRDEAGALYRAKIAGRRFDRVLRERKAVLEAARTSWRDRAAAEIRAALKPIFAEMTARVPGYANWYFDYLTKYELMGHALLPAIHYLRRSRDVASRQDKSLAHAIRAHVVEYIETQYAERVVRPREAEIRLRDAFDKTYTALHAHWRRIGDEQREAMRTFIKEQAGSAERLSADQPAGIELDWDGSRDNDSTIHEEGIVERRFRRGLLSVKLTIQKSAATLAEPNTSENATTDADAATHVIVNLFDKMVGPAVSQVADLAIGVVAASFAHGTTIGFGVAAAAPMATAVPIAATVGFTAMILTEVLSNRLEESLTRAEFEEGLRRTVVATEDAIETMMILALRQHVAAWYADIVNPGVAK